MKSINEFSILSPPDPTKANLGHGSYGVVKLAKHLKNNSIYALKIVFFSHFVHILKAIITT